VLQSSTGDPRNTKPGGEGYEDTPVSFSPDLISLARRSVTSPSNVWSPSSVNGLDAVDIIISNRICTAAAQSTGVLRAGDPSSHRAPRQSLGCARFALSHRRVLVISSHFNLMASLIARGGVDRL